MPIAEYDRLDGLALGELVNQGEIDPLELLETAIARVEQRDGPLNAVIDKLYDRARQRLRRHFAALRYDRYSFLVTEAVRKRQCKRVEELSAREREAIEHLPKDRRKGALNYLQYRLRKCGIQQPLP